MNTPLNPLVNPFHFTDLDVRTAVDEHNQAWFCAKDVCEILDITWSGATLQNIPESFKLMLKLNTSFGEKDTNFINIGGLFNLVMRSNKPNAVDFQNWVCGEVLPEIYRLQHQWWQQRIKMGINQELIIIMRNHILF